MRQAKVRQMGDGRTEKLCPHCGQWKDTGAYSPKRGGKGAKVRSWCKECCVRDVADWRTREGRWRSPLVGRIQRLLSNIVHMGGTLRSADLHTLYKQQGGRCYYTGVQMKLMSDIKNDPLIMSADRLDANNGYTLGNVVLCCYGANVLKGRHSPEMFYNTLRLFYKGAAVKRGWGWE